MHCMVLQKYCYQMKIRLKINDIECVYDLKYSS